jgi:hypothetical protein
MPLVSIFTAPLLAVYGRDVRPPELALHRADVDDLAALARDHAARHRLADDEHAVDVGAHQLVPVGLREFVERRTALHAGVVDEDVDRADLALDALDRGGGRVGRGHVERERMHRRAFAAQPGRGLLQLGVVAAVEDDRRTGTGQPAREREADAGARAGDEGDAPAQVEEFQDGVHRWFGLMDGRLNRHSTAPAAPASR